VYSPTVWSEQINRRYAVIHTPAITVTLLQFSGIRSDVYECVTCLDSNLHNTF